VNLTKLDLKNEALRIPRNWDLIQTKLSNMDETDDENFGIYIGNWTAWNMIAWHTGYRYRIFLDKMGSHCANELCKRQCAAEAEAVTKYVENSVTPHLLPFKFLLSEMNIFITKMVKDPCPNNVTLQVACMGHVRVQMIDSLPNPSEKVILALLDLVTPKTLETLPQLVQAALRGVSVEPCHIGTCEKTQSDAVHLIEELHVSLFWPMAQKSCRKLVEECTSCWSNCQVKLQSYSFFILDLKKTNLASLCCR
jgi:hypothetical protein